MLYIWTDAFRVDSIEQKADCDERLLDNREDSLLIEKQDVLDIRR